MATLKGKTISETYPLLLKIASSGVDGTLRNVEDGDGTTSALKISSGAIQVDNIKVDGNAITSTDSNGNIDLTPNGSGEVNISKVDIDSGAIDGTPIGGNSANTGAFTTLTASGAVTVTTATNYAMTIKSTDADAADIFRIIADDDGALLTLSKDASDDAELYLYDGSGNANVQISGNNLSYFNGGKVGIGDNNPSNFVEILAGDGVGDDIFALRVQNQEATDGRSYGLKVMAGSNSSDTTFELNDHDGSNVFMKVLGDGKTGVRTSSPSEALHVRGSAPKVKVQEDGSNHYVELEGGGSTAFINFYDSLRFREGTTERMRIDGSGNVGIQTSDTSGDLNLAGSFAAPLHVLQKPASQAYGLVVQSNSNANGGRIGIGEADSNFSSRANVIDIGFDSSTDFIFSRTGKDFIFGVNSAERLRITNEGRMVATIDKDSDTNYLDGDASLYLANSGVKSDNTTSAGTMIKFGDTNAGLVYGGSGTGTFKLMQRENTAVFIDASRRVGIGTTSPDATLAVSGTLLGGGQRFATSGKSVNVGSSTTFDISGSSSGFVFVKILVKVGWNGNASYQMHSMYEYVTSNYATTGGTATRSDIVQVEVGNAQFNYSDISISRPSDRTVRLTYAPSSGSGSHTCSIYVSGVFDSLS